MNLTTEIFDDVIVVHAPEELASEHASLFEERVAALDRRRVVLDLDGTELIDSRGLTALCDIQDKLRQEGGELKIAVTNGVNRKVLELTRLDDEIGVFEGVVDAVRSFHE